MLSGTIKLFIFILCMSAFGTAIAENTYNYNGNCPEPNGGRSIIDKWRFYQCECTSYVADKINEDNKKLKFDNFYKQPNGSKWSDAKNWKKAASRAGITLKTTPKKGDVAWWDGHVAYVESVSSKGKITVSEYNFDPPYGHKYSVRTIKKGEKQYPSYFIRF